MFFIKKLITPFLLPPGIFVVAVAVLGVAQFKRTRRAAWACFALAGLMWLCSSAPFEDLCFAGLENAYTVPTDLKADAVVVLGGGIYDNSPAVSTGERLLPSSLARMSAAAEVYRKTHLPLLVSGGAPFSSGSEAAADKLYLVESGVPPGAVFTEESSRDTRENALFSKKICDEKGYKKILLLTSAYHMRRAVFLFKKAGFAQIVPLPVARQSRQGRKYHFNDYLPGSGKPAKALNEWFGLVFYRLF
ncbi:MAG: YdcF family protein [Elusimicrobia bacterium]|nr:YdcF family protein [Elusimicrobiota bacterium]